MPEQFYSMTIAEYTAKHYGYLKNKEQEIKMFRQLLTLNAWQNAQLNAFAFADPQKMPSLRELLRE